MAHSFGEGPWALDGEIESAPGSVDYRAGFETIMRDFAWGASRGYTPTERQLVLAVTHAARIYSATRGGKPVSGRSPDWLRGRVDALRTLIRRGVAAQPESIERD
ncbi:MAG TPA: hypothetical protein VF808_11485 [Ktedonobacterales bacterium]